MTDDSRISQMMLEAEACLDKGDFTQARRLYADICRVTSDDSQNWLMLGTINGQLGNLEVAKSALQRSLELSPDNAEAHFALAHIHKAQGQPVQALAAAVKATEADPDFVDAWILAGSVAGELGQWPRAEIACARAAALAPDRQEGHVNLGNVFLGTGRVQQAEEVFQRALALGDSAEAWFGLGMALSTMNRDTEAEPAFAAAVQLASGSHVFREALAACLDKLGRSAEAETSRAGSKVP
jgi:tetratricopeptide (TPR) repeat protein